LMITMLRSTGIMLKNKNMLRMLSASAVNTNIKSVPPFRGIITPPLLGVIVDYIEPLYTEEWQETAT